ncbi:unnamed protein product [Arctogadus glacialis]
MHMAYDALSLTDQMRCNIISLNQYIPCTIFSNDMKRCEVFCLCFNQTYGHRSHTRLQSDIPTSSLMILLTYWGLKNVWLKGEGDCCRLSVIICFS